MNIVTILISDSDMSISSGFTLVNIYRIGVVKSEMKGM